jgi:hypothetical protein
VTALVLRDGYRPGDTGNGHTHGVLLLPSAALRAYYAYTPRRAAT